jgi:hypothetical protein
VSTAKAALFDALLQSGVVYVYLDPRKAEVPTFWQGQAKLVLSVGTCDKIVGRDDGGLVLSVATRPDVRHTCTVPWASIFALSGADHLGHVWEEDVPAEVSKATAPSVGRGGSAHE